MTRRWYTEKVNASKVQPGLEVDWSDCVPWILKPHLRDTNRQPPCARNMNYARGLVARVSWIWDGFHAEDNHLQQEKPMMISGTQMMERGRPETRQILIIALIFLLIDLLKSKQICDITEYCPVDENELTLENLRWDSQEKKSQPE